MALPPLRLRSPAWSTGEASRPSATRAERSCPAKAAAKRAFATAVREAGEPSWTSSCNASGVSSRLGQ